jgi:uncharacterized protein YjbI with pentapeptide repeats
LVQDTLTELWRKRVDNSLKLSVYVKLGGISGTLNKRATTFYNTLSASEKETVKYIFLALTQLGEGTEDTRRRVLKQDLITAKHGEGVIDVTIQKLANERLIVTDKQGETTDKKMAIEVAHEALIREWELLRQWLDQDRANLLQQRKIEALAQEWEKSGHRSSYLLGGFRLKEARKFQKEQALQYPLKKLGSDFIAKSVGKRRQNWLKLGVIPLVGVGVITFLGIRTYIVQSSWKIVQETQGRKYDIRRIHALQDLVLWKESLANMSLEKVDLSYIQIPNAVFSSTRVSGDRLYLYDEIFSGYFQEIDFSNAEFEVPYLLSTKTQGINLKEAILGEADLTKGNLTRANLAGAIINGGVLEKAVLIGANLEKANLEKANLYLANLYRANLNGTNLNGANLHWANLRNANLREAQLINTKLLTDAQIKSACFWEQAIYKGHYNREKKEWITDITANQKYIKYLAQDIDSDPTFKRDCNMWKK